MFKTVIIEDDGFAREMLQDLITKKAGAYSVIGFFDSVKSASKSLLSLQPDLVFLDMQLPDGKGFEILEKLDQIPFEVIVTTQHDTFMLDAIKHSALDYLIKPVTKKNLDAALIKFENKIQSRKDTVKFRPLSQMNKLILPMNEGLIFITVSDIIRLESEGSYTAFYTCGKQKYLTSRNLATYESQLVQQSFFRVHHSHLINLNHIEKYVRGEGGYVVMSDKSTIEVSRRKKEDFLKALGQ